MDRFRGETHPDHGVDQSPFHAMRGIFAHPTGSRPRGRCYAAKFCWGAVEPGGNAVQAALSKGLQLPIPNRTTRSPPGRRWDGPLWAYVAGRMICVCGP